MASIQDWQNKQRLMNELFDKLEKLGFRIGKCKKAPSKRRVIAKQKLLERTKP